jgi:hypothetical protein
VIRLILAGLTASVAFAQPSLDQQVQAILAESCAGCHGGAKPVKGLKLDSLATAQSARAQIVERVTATDASRMPPTGPLPSAKIAILQQWSKQQTAAATAATPKHWSYRRIERPANGNSIDALVEARLQPQGLKFSPEASPETLLRRVSLDLTGLPPTPAEIDAFLADTRPGAYERAVDRLLASPHYGERWARPWLDLARYADTNGYEKDKRRTMWAYRDWVIQALNQDMGFDQFTIEQIAGDMLPGASASQKIATGFHRNTMLNEEGGVDKEEAHFEVLVDRVNTTATVWLGSTLGCTQCHNHKYDAFTQRDYYSMMAFFNNGEKAVQSYGDTSTKFLEPLLDLASPDQEKQRAALKTRITAIEQQLKTQTPALDREKTEWEQNVLAARAAWQPLANLNLRASNGTQLKQDATSAIVLATGPNPQRETFTLESRAPEGLARLTGVRIEALPHASLPRGGPGRDTYGNFNLTEVTIEIDGRPIEFSRILADNGRVETRGSNHAPSKQLWIVDASKEDQRLRRQIVFVPRRPLDLTPDSQIRISVIQNSEFLGQAMGCFRLSVTSAADASWIVKPRHTQWEALEKTGHIDAADFRAIATSLNPVRDELKDLRSELDRLDIPSALVMAEQPGFQRPFDFIRNRGGFANKTTRVFANVPAAFPPLPESEMPNRLGLARWLVSRDNPLTARVTVNRLWEQYFGRGIVETSEDFGTQGAPPTHPELLDWLAAELMESKWSLKHIHRLIVTSRTYRQTSRVTPELLAADPYNKFLARGPRFRMEAEMIRDLTLASSGLLSRKLGGPSVFPHQPDGIWDVPYSDEKWIESQGEDRYRRGLYTFLRRSALYPSMQNFDATSREVCTVRRVRTNTPLQALTTLNDPAFFETARALASRLLKEAVADPARVQLGFRLTTGRLPHPNELDRILGWLADERAYFSRNAAESKRLGPTPDAAAYTMLANVLLNLDETLTKE